MNQFIQQLINGLSLGSIYALIALGYTMVYGVLRFINFAHSDVLMLGAFAAFYLTPMIAPHLGEGATQRASHDLRVMRSAGDLAGQEAGRALAIRGLLASEVAGDGLS